MNPFLKVAIESEYVDIRSGNKNGKDWSMSTQAGWAYFVDPSGVPERHPSKIKITLEKGAKPYPVGDYFLSPASFYRGDFDALLLRPILHPMPVTLAKAA